MTFTVLVTMTLKPEHAEGFAARLPAVLAETRRFEGCVQIQGYRCREEPNRLFIHEQWQTEERYAAYVSWRRSAGTLDKLAGIMLEPMHSRVLDQVA
jgi:quinol monooxygenase YgiN